eukprot:scaffold11622_cov20-Tisochrysis_lutea.AAC.1
MWSIECTFPSLTRPSLHTQEHIQDFRGFLFCGSQNIWLQGWPISIEANNDPTMRRLGCVEQHQLVRFGGHALLSTLQGRQLYITPSMEGVLSRANSLTYIKHRKRSNHIITKFPPPPSRTSSFLCSLLSISMRPDITGGPGSLLLV